jgi:hypothetical protein
MNIWDESGRQLKLDRDLLERLRPLLPSAPLAGKLSWTLSQYPFYSEMLAHHIEELRSGSAIQSLGLDLFLETLAQDAQSVEQCASEISQLVSEIRQSLNTNSEADGSNNSK